MVTFGWSFLILPLPALSPVVVGVRPPISRMVSPSFFLVHRWLPITSSHLFPSGLSKLSASRGNGFLFGKDAAFAIPVSLLSYSNRSSFQRSLDGRRMRAPFTCFYDAKEKPEPNSPQEGSALDWPILERWDVPWQWQTIMLTMFACALSIALTELVEASVLPYLGLQIGELSLDEKAEVLFAGQFTVTAAVLGVIYGITNSFQPLPDDIFRYDLKEPFNLRNGWLLWAGIGFSGAVIAIALTGVALSFFTGGNPERETDALVRLLPLIGSSNIRTACLIGITGVLAPLLEETVFRGFLMVSLTKWLPTPVCVLITAALFALAHLTPAEFPQLFVLGTALGLSYAQTRNLLTPITIHSFWNSGVILLLTFLQVQGYDIRELLQASS